MTSSTSSRKSGLRWANIPDPTRWTTIRAFLDIFSNPTGGWRQHWRSWRGQKVKPHMHFYWNWCDVTQQTWPNVHIDIKPFYIYFIYCIEFPWTRLHPWGFSVLDSCFVTRLVAKCLEWCDSKHFTHANNRLINFGLIRHTSVVYRFFYHCIQCNTVAFSLIYKCILKLYSYVMFAKK